jgi:hypothetical protein
MEAVLRIRDVSDPNFFIPDTGSRVKKFQIPHPDPNERMKYEYE